MRSTLALALVASLGLFACAGSNEEAKSAADEENVWKGYTGDYAASSAEFAKPTFSKSAASPMKREPKGEEVAAPEKKEAAPASSPAKAKEAPAPAVDEPVAGFVAAKKPTSKGTVKGESISTLTEAQLTAGALAATKSKSALSSGTMTGKQYEVITVETKKGTIKITRPAATPNPNGPSVTSPSNKLGDIAKNESAWFDEEGDCIVVVSSPKKASSAKLLNSIVKH